VGGIWPYFVGDVHGCFDALRRLEDRIAAHAAANGVLPLVVVLGDLVDRGPNSRAVVAHVRAGMAAGTHVALQGNHEQELLENVAASRPDLFEEANATLPAFLLSFGQRQVSERGLPRYLPPAGYAVLRRHRWLSQGGAETLASYGCTPAKIETWAIDPDHLAWLARLPILYEDDLVVATHAFVTQPDIDVLRHPEDYTLADLMRAAYTAAWRRRQPNESPDPKRMHVSGHTPKGRPIRFKRIRAIQVDTGCFMGGRLTAWCSNADRFLSVPGLDPPYGVEVLSAADLARAGLF
jgi:hypothetical protein